MSENRKLLEIEDISFKEIKEEYGTPIYVYDKEKIKKQYRKLDSAFSEHLDNFQIHYAAKANTNPEIAETLVEEGANLDCASKAELKLAEYLGLNPEDIIYTAPFNTEEELNYALKNNVTVNFDGIYLLNKIDEIPEKICFRVDPGIGDGDHGLVFGGGDTKFGISEDQAIKAYQRAKDQGAKKFGIHMMTGSNIREPGYFEKITRKLLEIADKIANETGIEFEFVDIGGGLGIPYEQDSEPLDIEETAERVSITFKKGVEKYEIGEPELRVEPGRYLVAESGVLLTEVTAVKNKEGTRYIGIDTGMHHMIRPMLLDAYAPIQKIGEKREEVEQTIVGPVCSSKDVMAENRMLSRLEAGDLIGIMNTGAYGFSMASNWNSRPLPPEVMVENSEYELIRDSQKPEDIFHGTSFNN